jgi:hypothetical protein
MMSLDCCEKVHERERPWRKLDRSVTPPGSAVGNGFVHSWAALKNKAFSMSYHGNLSLGEARSLVIVGVKGVPTLPPEVPASALKTAM